MTSNGLDAESAKSNQGASRTVTRRNFEPTKDAAIEGTPRIEESATVRGQSVSIPGEREQRYVLTNS